MKSPNKHLQENPMIPEYRTTSNYNQFKNFDGNRATDQNHIDELIRSIKNSNKLHLHPIIVDQNKNIIDGQHRLAAARELKLPIYYIVDVDAEKSDIPILNTNRRNWLLTDYISFYQESGLEDYIFIQNIREKHKKTIKTFSTLYEAITCICTNGTHAFSHLVRSGKIKLENKHTLEDFLDFTLPKCKEINHMIRVFNKKMSPTLFFKTKYIRCLCICYKIMTKKQYQELWDCLYRDYSLMSDVNSTHDLLERFQKSYNTKKTVNALDFKKMQCSL